MYEGKGQVSKALSLEDEGQIEIVVTWDVLSPKLESFR